MKEITEIKKAVSRLDNETVRSCLQLALIQIGRLKQTPDAASDPIDRLIELYDELVPQPDPRSTWSPAPGCTHVHIAIGDSFAGSMRLALTELGLADRHKLIILADNYAIGPLGGLDSPEGREARWKWFRQNIVEAVDLIYTDVEEEHSRTRSQLEQIPEQAEIIVWTSRSVREQAGMRYAMHLLRHLPNPIRVCDAAAICEELFNRPDAHIEYLRSGEIPHSKLKQAIMRMDDAARRLSKGDIARLAGEWHALSEQGGVLRIWRDGAIVEVPADYYDAFLLDTLDEVNPPASDGTYRFIMSARLIGQALGECEQDIGYEYLEHRVRELIYQGMLEIRGIPVGMRYYGIRRKK